jgi:hypothetical protein
MKPVPILLIGLIVAGASSSLAETPFERAAREQGDLAMATAAHNTAVQSHNPGAIIQTQLELKKAQDENYRDRALIAEYQRAEAAKLAQGGKAGAAASVPSSDSGPPRP